MYTDSDFPGLVENAQEMEQSQIAHPQAVAINVLGLGLPLAASGLARFSRVVQRVPTDEASMVERYSVRREAINR